ncbi:MAG: pilin [Pseudomonadales bacterium]|nr:pilin [Pseudomonadales bacterium]
MESNTDSRTAVKTVALTHKLEGSREQGFTLIEMVVVIALISILAAVALPRMLETYDNAHEAAVFGAGGALASAVVLVRSQWVANSTSLAVDGVDGFGNDDVATSAEGWPTDVGQGAGSSHNQVMDSADRCARIWRGVLVANAPSVTTSGAINADYLVEAVGGNCRYSYRRSSNNSYIVYNARTGEVVTTIE